MALTDADKRAFRNALCDRSVSSALITTIDAGSAAALTDRQEQVLGKIFPSKTVLASVVAAFETGTALSDRAIRMLHNAVGSKLHGGNLATEINSLT